MKHLLFISALFLVGCTAVNHYSVASLPEHSEMGSIYPDSVVTLVPDSMVAIISKETINSFSDERLAYLFGGYEIKVKIDSASIPSDSLKIKR